jgi:uncharacterized protein YutE (UPF0331/DUF86 family)
MSFDELFIRTKFKDIEGYLGEIKDLLKFSDKEILDDSGRMHIAERLVQLIVDAILDINQHIIKEQNLRVFEDFQGTFQILAENNVLPEDFANKIAPVVSVRNRIVHGYESLNKKLFIGNLRKNYSDFDNYIEQIKKYLKA